MTIKTLFNGLCVNAKCVLSSIEPYCTDLGTIQDLTKDYCTHSWIPGKRD